MTPENPDFHAQHSPMGAHSSFTLGMHHANSGAVSEKGSVAEGATLVGYRTASGQYHYFPFFEKLESEKDRYVSDENAEILPDVIFSKENIEREYLWATDKFSAPGIQMEVISPFDSIPDPAQASDDEMRFATCPATLVRLTFDNQSSEDWQGFFALSPDTRWTALDSDNNRQVIGGVSRDQLAVATTDQEAKSFMDFTHDTALDPDHSRPHFLLGQTCGLEITVPAGEQKELVLCIAYYLENKATFNRSSKYYYTKLFTDIKHVINYAMTEQGRYFALAAKRDEELSLRTDLNDEQKFLIAHATRSYYGSTEFLIESDKPLWVVNEGEYLMMNTFDLTIDMLFFELKFNPWTVKNVLENFVSHYRYYDEVFSPENPEKLYPGGVSFAHDMGVANQFSPEPYSSYESSGLDRKCFSFMTYEQLCNWVLTAGVYLGQNKDTDFFTRHRGIFQDCLTSLLNRDNPDPAKRNGLMSFESSMTKGGGEITTYDSLDHSLGQSRNNIYLAGKAWASYLIIHDLFKGLDTKLSEEAFSAAQLTAKALCAGYDEDLGFIPAVLENDNKSAIIPAIEALVYPWEFGSKEYCSEDGPFAQYIKVLKRHFNNIHNTDACLYPDGAWKLSSTADNSWMSKISICQYVAREILKIDLKDASAQADLAHARWQREGAKYHACSDQFTSGQAIGSLYYPRIVSNILWLKETC
ncbi:beta-xylosidase (1,4-beta-D-xylan xylohydrolase) [Lentisphaera araneosa HTCC2155]|uniref:Beta-xylosidase (1,4-beta-D-xylan xylohydrolase) n=1 Tax=Lentisphaera araneosa HTCC2155 TaxID=313628 RepID=A6DLV3_9BACT|nr:glycoside hydrolase family 52 protein [Lentisphaera araneosa]EDM27251.1 beta-xylosidase (1,4-beta-D-xylan xylohydrolase) [Lentisphaera araneosa HTCC2155]